MKALILLALCLSLTINKSVFTLTTVPVALNAAITYKSRYTLDAANIDAQGLATLTFTFPTDTGNAPATFTYQIFAADGTTPVHGPVSLTANYGGSTSDNTWNIGDETVNYVL